MTAMRTDIGPWGRQFMAALMIACGLTIGSLGSAIAQIMPPGFESVPRPPGSIGPSQNLMPPGSSSGVLTPAAPASPLQLGPPPAQPVLLPPPAAPAAPPVVAAPAVPMVPA